MSKSDSFGDQRRSQKRPTTNQSIMLTPSLMSCLSSQIAVIGEDKSPMAKTLANSLTNFMKSGFSPEDFQKMMSSVASVWKAKEQNDQLSPQTILSIVNHWLMPWLCRCDLRFVHKGIINLLRTDLVMKNQELHTAVNKAFSDHLEKEFDAMLRPGANYMDSANLIDAVSVSASPIFPEVFEMIFPKSIRVASDILASCVQAAINGDIDTATIHSDNLEEVRFCVRVVATHVHRFIGTIKNPLSVEGPLTALLHSSVAMLSTAAFPKDVLNAAGLLVATIITESFSQLKESDNDSMTVIHAVVKAVCEQPAVDATGLATSALPSAAQKVIQSLFASTTGDKMASAGAIQQLFSRLTHNGRLAFSKGLLSHFSSPMALGANTVLLHPMASGNTILHSIIFPAALGFCDEQGEPDTRFMAIQTLDHIVKYLAATFTELAKSTTDTTTNPTQRLPSWFVKADVAAITIKVVSGIISTITGLWDDPTQQVSGPLYNTYGTILDVSDSLRKLTGPSEGAAVVDPLASFQSALKVRADRRGKYHTMLALLPRLGDAELLQALRATQTSDSESSTAVFGQFVQSLIVTANNPKICSVSGDLFAVMASRFLADHVLWQECIISAVTNVITSPTLTTGLSVTEAMARGNIVAHMVTPILKKGPMGTKLLHDLLGHWATTSGNAPSAYLVQATVDLLYRARSSGVSLEGVKSEVWAIVRLAADAYDTTLRLAALNLLLLSTKGAERATEQQMELATRQVSWYSQNGGDSTTRNDTLGLLRLWMKRLTDSLNASTKKDESGGEAAFSSYASAVFAHLKSIVAILVSYLVGKSEAGEHSSERRYFCFSALDNLWGSVAVVYADPKSKIAYLPQVQQWQASGEVLAALYPLALCEPLKAALSEGWDMLREVAAGLLCTLCNSVGAAKVFADPSADLTAALANISSGTHRTAQGAATTVVILFANCWSIIAASTASLAPLPPVASGGETLEAYVNRSVIGLCEAIDQECVMVDIQANATMIRTAPLHGRLLLVGSLFASCLSAGHVSTAQRILMTCTRVASHCSGLVSGSDKVDCRGHVFSEGDAAKESDNRVIVNNSWLGVRAACTVSEKLLTVCSPALVGVDAVLGLCKALVSTLLLTKHNGVMGKARATLRFICRLVLRTKSDELRAIPSTLMDDLLGESGVTSSDEGRILRRSQGLPHAILPILEAEDPTLPFVLFPKTMRLLISLIGTAQEQIQPLAITVAHSVNALNVLKFIFDNSIFAARITPWAQDSFIRAASGFNNASWAVRNSSLMLFSSVVHRIVGDHPTKGGGAVTTSLHDLQSRIPKGLTYALEALGEAVERTAGGFAVHPALFPLLLLFSMLCPDAPHVVHDKSSLHVAPQLISVLKRCSGLRNLMVRAASASALVSVVPVADLERMAASLSLGVLASTDQNAVHGGIQHLQRMYAHYVGTLRLDMKNALGAHSNESTKAQMISILTTFATSDATTSVTCLTVSASYLALIADVMVVANSSATVKAILSSGVKVANAINVTHLADTGAFSDAYALLLVVAAFKLRGVDVSEQFAVANDIAHTSLLSEKVTAMLATYFRAQNNRRYGGRAYLVSELSNTVAHGADEATKVSTLHAAAMVAVSISDLFGLNVVQFAIQVLKEKTERHHPQVCENAFTVLGLVTKCNATASKVISSGSLPTIGSMCEFIATDENSGMRSALLEFVAVLCTHSSDSNSALPTAIEVASRPDQPTACRVAAVYALGVTHKSKANLSAVVSSLWLRLLHDDEEDVRRVTAHTLCKCINSNTDNASLMIMSQPFMVDYMVSHTEPVVEGNTDEARMVAAVFGSSSATTNGADVADDNANVADGENEDGEEDLFDEEQDNMYWESAVMNQIRSRLLRK